MTVGPRISTLPGCSCVGHDIGVLVLGEKIRYSTFAAYQNSQPQENVQNVIRAKLKDQFYVIK
jgi:hypothetical protein